MANICKIDVLCRKMIFLRKKCGKMFGNIKMCCNFVGVNITVPDDEVHVIQ